MNNTAIATCVTSVAGITGTMTITSETISTNDAAADVIGACINNGTLLQDADGLVQYAEDDVIVY